MKTCHLHIGMHKTGSSAIQNYLEKNRDKLLQSNFYYADMGFPNHSGPFSYALCFEPEKDSEIQFIEMSPDELQRRIDFFKQKLNDSLHKEYSDIIFSAEGIIKLTEDELITFREYLLTFVDQIKVYCYLREPIEYITSAFQQVIKVMPVSLDHPSIYPNYQSKFKKFETVFGALQYRLFSREALTNGDVVNDFCNWLQLPFLGSNYANASLGALATKFLCRFQHVRKKVSLSQEQLDLLEKTLIKLPYQKIILSTEVMRNPISEHIADFEWMADHLIKKNININFNINSITDVSYGNFYGVFSESEKEILSQLADSSVEFDSYIKAETGLSVFELVSGPLENMPNLELYIRKANDSAIVGRACFINDVFKPVEFTIYLNNEYVAIVKADIYRDDLIMNDPDKRSVGYFYDFGEALQDADLITLKVGNEIVFSGSFDY